MTHDEGATSRVNGTQGSRVPMEFIVSIGASLNLGVNHLADVLPTFFLNVVSEDEE